MMPCIHTGDRESDIYELFYLAKDQNTHLSYSDCILLAEVHSSELFLR